MNRDEAKALICEIGRRMYLREYVASNDGNISLKVSPDEVLCTPTGVSKGYMTPQMICSLDMEGNLREGTHKPSSEMKMHLRVYREKPLINAVVHAHPPIATAFSVAGIPLEDPILAEFVVMLGRVDVAPYATPGTEEVPDSIAPYLRESNALLLANHGALTWGSNLEEAYHRLESLEHYAKILLYTSHIIGKQNPLDKDQVLRLIDIRERMGIKTGGMPKID